MIGDPTGRWCRDRAGAEDWDKHHSAALVVLRDLASALGQQRPLYYHFLRPGLQCRSPAIHVAAWLQTIHHIAFLRSTLLYTGDTSPFHTEWSQLTGIRTRQVSGGAADANAVNAVRFVACRFGL